MSKGKLSTVRSARATCSVIASEAKQSRVPPQKDSWIASLRWHDDVEAVLPQAPFRFAENNRAA
jgi:hypothetical protein